MATCVDIESDRDGDGVGDGFALSQLTDGGLTGTIVPADFVTDGGCPPARHALAIDPGDGRPRVVLSWGHPDVDLDVEPVGTEIMVSEVQAGWERGFSFVVSDDDGVLLAVNGAGSLRSVADARIEHGGWRGSSISACGISAATNTRITVDDESRDVANGETVNVSVDGNAMRFHAFRTFTFGPLWMCTDTSNALEFALVRDPA